MVSKKPMFVLRTLDSVLFLEALHERIDSCLIVGRRQFVQVNSKSCQILVLIKGSGHYCNFYCKTLLGNEKWGEVGSIKHCEKRLTLK